MMTITVQKLKEKMSDSSAVIIDVRLSWQFGMGHIPGAINIPWLNAALDPAQYQGKTLYIYCLEGVRSARMVEAFRQQGFLNVINVEGGLRAWQQAEFELEK